MAGQVVHFEIPVDDPGRAKEFYEQAFGWGMDSMPQMGYTLVRTTAVDDKGMPLEPGAINGGMLKREAELTAPMITISVEDIDTSLEAIGRLGGSTVRPKMPVGDMGFAAYCKDTEGNVVGLWQNA